MNPRLSQHFLKDSFLAQKITHLLAHTDHYQTLVEIGPGKGALTKWLIQQKKTPLLFLIEIDPMLIPFLQKLSIHNPHTHIVQADFLTYPLEDITLGPMGIISNTPYHISSQIFFKMLAYRHQIQEAVCMVQHEVAQRITSKPGSKAYGILSVLLQAFYNVSYAFSVPATAFEPPPQVLSGVIHLVRNLTFQLDCNETFFLKIVRTAFQQRRKMLRNALKSFIQDTSILPESLLQKRAETLSVTDFVTLTQQLQHHFKKPLS